MIDLPMLIEQCAPQVAPSTLQAIIRTESGFNPLALNVNGNVRLTSQPRTAEEAAHWSQWLIDRNYSVDMGLMQVNSRNLQRLQMTPAQAFDPCLNIQAGAKILQADYERAMKIHGPGSQALLRAISSYNTGSFERGFRNGYVRKVIEHSAAGASVETIEIRCVSDGCTQGTAGVAPPAQKRAAGSFSRFSRAVSEIFHRARIYILGMLTIVTAVCLHRALRVETNESS